jgi:hypothetical protein
MDFNIFEKEEFKCLTERQKNLIKEMVSMSEGMKPIEAAGMIMRFLPVIESEGALTDEQKNAMMRCVIENMSVKERENMASLFRMAGII